LSGPETILVSGAIVSTTHVYEDGSPAFPAASTPRTPNVWAPSASAAYDAGLVHGANGPPSSRQRKPRPASLSAKTKDAVVLLVGVGGPPAIAGGDGATVSTVHVNTVARPVVPVLVSVARTWNVWGPSVRSV
jgi:hypothetical protein